MQKKREGLYGILVAIGNWFTRFLDIKKLDIMGGFGGEGLSSMTGILPVFLLKHAVIC